MNDTRDNRSKTAHTADTILQAKIASNIPLLGIKFNDPSNLPAGRTGRGFEGKEWPPPLPMHKSSQGGVWRAGTRRVSDHIVRL